MIADIADIADIIGDEAALNLFIRFAGRGLTVPKICPPDHIIVLTIGADNAAKFCHWFRSEYLMFPNGGKLIIQERNRNIFADYQAGKSYGDLATHYRLTQRQIITIIGGMKSKAD